MKSLSMWYCTQITCIIQIETTVLSYLQRKNIAFDVYDAG